METVRTVICKLDPTTEQVVELEATLKAFANACNGIANVCRELGSTSKFKVQQEFYEDVRREYGLSANLAIRAIARTCSALKVPEKANSAFEPTSIDFDERIFRFHEKGWMFGVTTLSGRIKVATCLGDYQRSMLAGRHPTSATLVRRRDGQYFFHVQLSDPAPPPITTTGTLGVDLGVVNLAVDSTGEPFAGDGVEFVRQRYARIRRTCQATGTRSAKRHLQKVRRKESNFRKDRNHKIAKAIVVKAQGTASAIGIEDLEGIGKRTTVHKSQRNRMKGWAFHQLRGFITYKALAAGVPVIPVDPRNTSRTCSACGHCDKRNRKNRNDFECRSCGYQAPADWNAARNIGARAEVLRPDAGVVDAGKSKTS